MVEQSNFDFVNGVSTASVEFGNGLCSRLFVFNNLKVKISDSILLWVHNVGNERFFDFCLVSFGFPFPDSFVIIYRFVLQLSAVKDKVVA